MVGVSLHVLCESVYRVEYLFGVARIVSIFARRSSHHRSGLRLSGIMVLVGVLITTSASHVSLGKVILL